MNSMINIMVRYRVKKQKIAEVKKAIREFVRQVKKREKGTLIYESFQLDKHSTEFVHFMRFKDKKAEETHRKSEHVKKFVAVLYPVCEKKPIFIGLNEINI